MSAKNDISEAEYALHDYVSGERLEWPQGLGELARDFDDFVSNRDHVQTLEIATPVHALKWDKIQARAKQRRSGSRIRRLMPFMGIAASIVLVMGLLSVTVSPSLEFNEYSAKVVNSAMQLDGAFVGPPGAGGGLGASYGDDSVIPIPEEMTKTREGFNKPTVEEPIVGSSPLNYAPEFDGDDASKAFKFSGGASPANFTNLVRRGSIKLQHDTPSSLQQRIVDSVMASGGAVTQLRRSGTGADTRIAMELSIPSAQFVGFVAALSGMGEVIDQSEDADDATGALISIEARLDEARDYLARLDKLAEKGDDSLAAAKALEQDRRDARRTVKELELSQENLKNRIAMASLSVEIAATLPKAPEEREEVGALENAADDGVKGLVAVTAFLLRAFLVSLPVLALFTLGYVIFRLRRRPSDG